MIEKQPILIQAHHICHAYNDKKVLQDVTLKIHRGEIVTLIGPNGAGKSTLLKVLLNLIQPDTGKVIRKNKLRTGFMPQKIQIDHTLPMTVQRFLQLGTQQNNQKLQQHLDNLTEELEIESLLQQPIQKVSGGEMQRILLARALINQPELLVLDEPVQGVDIQGQTEIYQFIHKVRNRYGCGVLMVSHDLHLVMKNTDQVICLNQHICCSGTPQSLHNHPEFLAIFGHDFAEMAVYEHHHNEQSCQHTHGQS